MSNLLVLNKREYWNTQFEKIHYKCLNMICGLDKYSDILEQWKDTDIIDLGFHLDSISSGIKVGKILSGFRGRQ